MTKVDSVTGTHNVRFGQFSCLCYIIFQFGKCLVTHSGLENLEKSSPKKIRKIKEINFTKFDQITFFASSKMAKIGKKFKTAKNAISWKKNF